MPGTARFSEHYIDDITVPDDGLRARPSQWWAADKLGIEAMYLPAFAAACQKAGAYYFVDAMAGNGHCEMPDGSRVLGSTLIALNSEPRFTRCISIENREANAEVLRLRTASHGDRSTVLIRDCNRDLPDILKDLVPHWAPMLVLFDPEGLELDWSTVSKVALHRSGERKAELLILMATSWIPRVMGAAEPDQLEQLQARLDASLPFAWWDVWARRKTGELEPEEARNEIAERYRRALEEKLGYRRTLARRITRGDRDGSTVYHLVFATDDEGGARIMEYCFERMHANIYRPKLAAGWRRLI